MKTTIVLASLLALVGYAYLENEAELRTMQTLNEYEAKVSQAAAKSLFLESEDHYMQYRHFLKDDSKSPYRSMLPMLQLLIANVELANELKESCIERLYKDKINLDEQRQIIASFIDSTTNMIDDSRAIVSFYLNTNTQLYGLRPEEIEIYLAYLSGQLKLTNWQEVVNNLSSKQLAKNNLLNSVMLEINLATKSVINSLTSMTTGRPILFEDDMYPHFYPIKTGNSPGDLVTLMVLCKDCVDSNGKTYVKLKINGKPFEFDYNGILFYQGTRSTNGKLSMEYWVRNPLTGIELKDQYYYDLNGKQLDPIL